MCEICYLKLVGKGSTVLQFLVLSDLSNKDD